MTAFASHTGAQANQTIDRQYFDDLYAKSDDPWRLRASWYEERKRAVLLASLPAVRYARAYEPGCAAGDLTVLLAQRCDYLLATDGSERALAQTRERLSTQHHVDVEKAWLPRDWPGGAFDLMVLSEFLYYLPPSDLDRLLSRVAAARTANGVVVACHWRAPIEGCAMAGDALHEVLHSRLGLPRVVHYQDHDFTLDVWQEGVPSAAQRELRR